MIINIVSFNYEFKKKINGGGRASHALPLPGSPMSENDNKIDNIF